MDNVKRKLTAFTVKVWGRAVVRYPVATAFIVAACVKGKMAVLALAATIGEWL